MDPFMDNYWPPCFCFTVPEIESNPNRPRFAKLCINAIPKNPPPLLFWWCDLWVCEARGCCDPLKVCCSLVLEELEARCWPIWDVVVRCAFVLLIQSLSISLYVHICSCIPYGYVNVPCDNLASDRKKQSNRYKPRKIPHDNCLHGQPFYGFEPSSQMIGRGVELW